MRTNYFIIKMYYNPLEEFEILELVIIKAPSITITNITLSLILGTIIMTIITIRTSKEKLINKRKILSEIIYDSILNIIRNQIGYKEEKYIGLIYGLFSIIVICNLLGMIPYTFTATSHFVLTLSLSIAIIIAVTIIGFKKHNISFFSVLIPEGTPLGLIPLLVILELLSYIARAISLGVRLGANCLAGHTLLKIISIFSWQFIQNYALYLSIIPLIFISALISLELGIALLQSYVFTTLTCLYIRDSINLH
jgi:F-type H+-transporting ATPase subunit a